MTKTEYLRVISLLQATWPKDPLPEATEEAWWPLYADLAIDPVVAALQATAARSPFRPQPSEVRLWVLDREAGALSETWAEVWAEVHRAISVYGGYRNPDEIPWRSATTRELVRLVGWQYLCWGEDGTAPPPGVLEAQTREKWQELRSRARVERSVEGLPAVRAMDRPEGLARLGDVINPPELAPANSDEESTR